MQSVVALCKRESMASRLKNSKVVTMLEYIYLPGDEV